MAEGGDVGQDISFAWEDESWMALPNSENSAGTGSDENLSQKMNSNKGSNSPTPKEVVPEVAVLPELPETAAKAAAAVLPPPAAVAGKRKRGNGKQPEAADGGSVGGKGGETDHDHEMHIWTERERRKKMRNMFTNLQELLPQLPQKADKSTVVDGAVNYIKTLQQKLQNLQKQKLEMLQGLTTMTNPLAASASSSREAFIADQGSSASQHHHEMGISPFGMSRYSTDFKSWTSPNMVLSVCGDKAQINICCPKKVGLFSAICFFLEKHKIQVISAHVSSDQYRSMYMIQAHAIAGVDQFAEGALSFDDIFQLAAGEIMMHMSTL